jgi:hypothetical protein
MTDDSGTSELSSPVTNGAAGDSGSAISVRSNAVTEAFAAVDEKELSIAAKRFIISEINRLVEENRQLKQFKDKYHDADKRLAVLKETVRPFRTNLFLSSACLIAGSAGVAAAPSFLSLSSYGWYVLVGVSAMLLIAGITARVEVSIGSMTRQPGSFAK